MAQAHPDVRKDKDEDAKLHMPLAEAGDKPKPTIGVRGEPIEDGERDPDTIAEEQRRRSAEYEANLGRGDLGGRTEDKEHKLPPPKK